MHFCWNCQCTYAQPELKFAVGHSNASQLIVFALWSCCIGKAPTGTFRTYSVDANCALIRSTLMSFSEFCSFAMTFKLVWLKCLRNLPPLRQPPLPRKLMTVFFQVPTISSTQSMYFITTSLTYIYLRQLGFTCCARVLPSN
jgi:hypothetical protein